ncbi:Protein CBR-SRAB-1 [Caenorhabditis briggsae]|uniref:Protein CBR-SRAB-1 n=1 Tax=Caenorhabditis briggsae TaxID=6238 RepID=A8X6U3_CAEBR|nr:Protein CBR-SRAB-1 [Caenorhabditis briggsae]CAP28354.2 Protein CBR-SRAB-1 [Caenorhabditis briggsae]
MPNQTNCEQMAQVATSSALRLVLSITTILCFLCIPSCLYCLWRIQRSMKLHFNSKCIFITHNIFILIHVIARITLHGKDLRTISDHGSVDVRYFHQEQDVCIAVLFLRLQSSGNFGEIIIYYCWLASTGNRYYLNIPIFLVVISQLVTIPALLYLLKKNERFRETSLGKHATLTQRYQIFENLRTLNMFRIMSIITWIYVTYNAAATYIANMYLKSMSMDRQFAYIEVVHCLPFYYLALSFFIYREDRKPRSQFVIKVTNYEPNYFNDLQRFFDDAFVKIKPTHPKH